MKYNNIYIPIYSTPVTKTKNDELFPIYLHATPIFYIIITLFIVLNPNNEVDSC